MDRIRNASNSASVLNLHDALFEKTLPPASHDECFALSLKKMSIRFDFGLDVGAPTFPSQHFQPAAWVSSVDPATRSFNTAASLPIKPMSTSARGDGTSVK
jgi:hypothetical protein